MFFESNVSAVDFLLLLRGARFPRNLRRSSAALRLLELPRSLLEAHQVPLYTLLCFVSFMDITTTNILIIMTSVLVDLNKVIVEIYQDIANVC